MCLSNLNVVQTGRPSWTAGPSWTKEAFCAYWDEEENRWSQKGMETLWRDETGRLMCAFAPKMGMQRHVKTVESWSSLN